MCIRIELCALGIAIELANIHGNERAQLPYF
jgi:hypothetical protein